MAHECSLYCDGEVHAMKLLSGKDWSKEQLLRILRKFPPPGFEVLDIRPAHEADIQAWHGQADVGMGSIYKNMEWQVHAEPRADNPFLTVPWLAMVCKTTRPGRG